MGRVWATCTSSAAGTLRPSGLRTAADLRMSVGGKPRHGGNSGRGERVSGDHTDAQPPAPGPGFLGAPESHVGMTRGRGTCCPGPKPPAGATHRPGLAGVGAFSGCQSSQADLDRPGPPGTVGYPNKTDMGVQPPAGWTLCKMVEARDASSAYLWHTAQLLPAGAPL